MPGITMRAVMVISACLALAKCEAPPTENQYNTPTLASLKSYQPLSGGVASMSGAPQMYAHNFQQPYRQYTSQYSHKYQLPIVQYTQQYLHDYLQPLQIYTQEYSHQYHHIQQYTHHNKKEQPVEVHTHVYFHFAPEELQPVRARVLPPVAPPQKHYKIIFVQAPSVPAPAPVIVPPQPLIEEKTLIYVLSKKAEEPETLVLPTPAATETSKPEVHFIKYKTEKEYSDIVSAGSQLGQVEQLDGVIGTSTIDYSKLEDLDDGGDLESPLRASDHQIPDLN